MGILAVSISWLLKISFYLVHLWRAEFFLRRYIFFFSSLWEFAIFILQMCTLLQVQRFPWNKLKHTFVFKSPQIKTWICFFQQFKVTNCLLGDNNSGTYFLTW